jgi:phospholipid/cholesterol/gamma-HCH transport system ATP-binding protein
MLFRRELVMFGPREVLLTSEEPVVKQFLNGSMNGPIGMSEEKDAEELAAESGQELPPLPPIPIQLGTSDGSLRRAEKAPGQWCRANDVTPPPGSFLSGNAGVPGVSQSAGLESGAAT